MSIYRGDVRAIGHWRLCATLVMTLATAGLTARQEDSPDRIWRDPGNMAALDLIGGAGGTAHAPDPAATFTFVADDSDATTPKFDVTDARGMSWKVKLGEEARAETAATRFLWAAGYFVDEDYYLPEITVRGLPTLRRGQEFVAAGGVVHGARLERKAVAHEKLANWDWFDNPFVGQRELNGLRVMMALLNNWDLKQINNSVYVVDGVHHYLVSDAGATFGNTGNPMTRSKSAPQEYEDSLFQSTTTPDFIDFVLHSRPFFWTAVDVSNYRTRTKMEQITKHIPRADAKWLGDRLSSLTDEQIRDGFRAAGYTANEVAILTRTIHLRIAALEAL